MSSRRAAPWVRLKGLKLILNNTMTTALKPLIEFGKNYNTTFGTMNYSTRTLRVSGDVRFGYNEKFGTVYVLLDDDSEKVVEKLNTILKEYGTEIKVVEKFDSIGVQIKVKKSDAVKSLLTGDLFNYPVSVSLFTDKTGKVFASLIV